MEIVVEELSASNIQHVNQVDGTFLIDSILRLQAENDIISYTITSIPSFYKRYPDEAIDPTTYLTDPNKIIFFAYVEEQLAGQIILHKNWNNYAYVQDISVDAKFRKQDIGTRLIAQAIQWAKSKNLPGIMLETQNTNVGACRLYECCGFQLGGFDRLLYKGIAPDTIETALYWYLIF